MEGWQRHSRTNFGIFYWQQSMMLAWCCNTNFGIPLALILLLGCGKKPGEPIPTSACENDIILFSDIHNVEFCHQLKIAFISRIVIHGIKKFGAAHFVLTRYMLRKADDIYKEFKKNI
ncbi:unnamed protein product [Cylicocyclus nassatus]|uniref:Uncharacterized protein n=1 Tax=Cylicocyclus nassatus TaxID=53992 RepID=A0AA36HBL0_CYLNA|nr:unnamed protein product [Cylicocyclus nassatus]